MEEADRGAWGSKLLGFVPRPDRQTLRLLVRLAGLLALAAAGFAGFALYESYVLGLPPLGEMPPLFDPFHGLKEAFALTISALIAWTVYCDRSGGCGFDAEPLPAPARSAAYAVLVAAVGSTILFLADPILFGETAQEDQPVEWISALLLFGTCGLCAAAALRRPNRIAALLALALAALFFVMAMEEISWMQRILGFETPRDVATVNWQGEFNLHNVQTDLFENVFYVGSAAFLIFLPFIADAAPWLRTLGPLSAFIPGRGVAAVSAPLSIFNYGMWNVLPQQITMMLTLFVLCFYASASRRRGHGREFWLFAILAVAVAAGQAAFLVAGHRMPDIWDASEYKELFIAVGFAAYAVGVNLRLRALP